MNDELYDGREAYLGLADELTDFGSERWKRYGGTAPLVEGDWDEQWLSAARAFAKQHALPFPPADIDTAAQQLRSLA